MRVDAVIALKFPAYLASHDRKIVWLIHQHRSAYELWDHPDFGDLSVQEDGATVRDLIRHGDRLALGRGQADLRELEERGQAPVGRPADAQPTRCTTRHRR